MVRPDAACGDGLYFGDGGQIEHLQFNPCTSGCRQLRQDARWWQCPDRGQRQLTSLVLSNITSCGGRRVGCVGQTEQFINLFF
jgi:hypothetical protein